MQAESMTSAQPTNPKHITIPEKIIQMQCDECNSYLKQLFLMWVNDSFKYLPNFIANFYMEAQLIVSLLEYWFTVRNGKPQPGDFLLNIQFKPLKKKTKILWLILTVIVPYVKKRISTFVGNYIQKQEQKPTISVVKLSILQYLLKGIEFTDRIVKMGEFINYAIFILKGKYRNLSQRILKIEMQFINPENKRNLDFSLMNRVLLWQVYEFFLKNVMPMAYSLVGDSLKNVIYLTSYMDVDKESTIKCMYCSTEQLIIPFRIKSCTHHACYYCMKQHSKEDKCPVCAVDIDEWVKDQN